MAKHKMVFWNLQKNSVAAYFAAIEIHNKPNILYRYETTTLLMMNAWELILKAYVKKYIKKKSIFTKDGHTIRFNKALEYVEEHINAQNPKSFSAIKENLLLIEDYRNNIAHYYNEQLEPYIFMLTAKAALNYVEFQKEYFGKDILAEDGLFILPLGFKLPFKPEDFLTKKAAEYASCAESREFIQRMVKVITDLNNDGIDESVVIGFDIYLKNVKQLSNHDLLVAITSKDEADASFSKVTKYQPTSDQSAQKINLSDEEFFAYYSLSYGDLVRACREKITTFKQGKKFNKIMGELKRDPIFSYPRKHNPSSNKSSETFFYTPACIDEIAKHF